MTTFEQAKKIAQTVHDAGGRALIVGGYARDEMMRLAGVELESKDIDLEVYGLTKNDLENLLSQFGQVLKIGKQFEVFQVQGIDVSLPRNETQVGSGHRDLHTEADPNLSFEKAFRRRDFTINALGLDPLTDQVIDLYGGVQDIQNGILRMVDSKTFANDPLRPLRAAQFVGRFSLEINPQTLVFAQGVDMSSLPASRIGEEWQKLLLLSTRPSLGLEAMLQIGVINQLHPELEKAISDSSVLDLLDQAATELSRADLSDNDFVDRLLMILCFHLDPEQIQSFLTRLEINHQRIDRIVAIVSICIKMDSVVAIGLSDSFVRHLSNDIHPDKIQDLIWLMEMIEVGSGSELLEVADSLGVLEDRPEPIVTGEDLIELGYQQGVELGEILDQVYQAQLNGELHNIEQVKAFLTNLSGVRPQ